MIVYASLASLGSNIDDNANMTSIFRQWLFHSIDINCFEVIKRTGWIRLKKWDKINQTLMYEIIWFKCKISNLFGKTMQCEVFTFFKGTVTFSGAQLHDNVPCSKVRHTKIVVKHIFKNLSEPHCLVYILWLCSISFLLSIYDRKKNNITQAAKTSFEFTLSKQFLEILRKKCY